MKIKRFFIWRRDYPVCVQKLLWEELRKQRKIVYR